MSEQLRIAVAVAALSHVDRRSYVHASSHEIAAMTGLDRDEVIACLLSAREAGLVLRVYDDLWCLSNKAVDEQDARRVALLK